MGMAPRFNFDGFINERGGDLNHGYTQVFRNGTIEATKAEIVRLVDQRRVIPGLSLEQQFFEVLSGYIVGLRNVGVSPPIVLMITLEGAEGAKYAVYRNTFGDPQPPIDRAVLSLPECVVNDYGADVDYHRAARPAFDALWNAVGYSSAQFFDNTGLWVGNNTGR
jgi:hypothetical protein